MVKLLRWTMRVFAVICALLAMLVGTAAWMHRTQGRLWFFSTPALCSAIQISPECVTVGGFLRREGDMGIDLGVSRFRVGSVDFDNANVEPDFEFVAMFARFTFKWHQFGVLRGFSQRAEKVPSFTEILCPTWAIILVLLLPMGVWMMAWQRQRKRVLAGHCISCGYDLRATPDKCPECGRVASGHA